MRKHLTWRTGGSSIYLQQEILLHDKKMTFHLIYDINKIMSKQFIFLLVCF